MYTTPSAGLYTSIGTVGPQIRDDSTAFNVGLGNGTFAAWTANGGNTAVGYQALTALTTGKSNTAIGYLALNAIVATATADFNTAVGSEAGFGATGVTGSALLGYRAGGGASTGMTGINNTCVGDLSGSTLTSGHDCTFVGQSAGGNNVTANYVMALGSAAANAVANTCIIGGTGAAALTDISPGTAGACTLGSAFPFSGLYLGTTGAFSIKKAVQVTLTQAQVVGMFATPVQLIAAPAAGNAVFIDSCVLNRVGGSAVFTGGGTIVVQYTNTIHGAGLSATAGATAAAATFLTSTTTNGFQALTGLNMGPVGAGTTSSSIIATGIFLSNQGAAFANAGAGASVIVTISYTASTLS
jgi:hypothetical protein